MIGGRRFEGRRARRWGLLVGGVVALVGVGWWVTVDRPPPRVARILDEAPVLPLSFLPDGKGLLVVLGKRQVQIRDTATGAIRKTFRPPIAHLTHAVSPDGRLLAWTLPGGNGQGIPHRIVVVDVGTGEERARVELDRPTIFTLAFTEDGATLRVLSWAPEPPDSTFAIHEWETRGWTPRPVPPLNVSLPGSLVALAPGGRRIATASNTSPVATLWEEAGGSGHLDLARPDSSGASAIAFTPEGRRILVARSQGPIEIWETATGSVAGVARLSKPGYRTAGFAFDRDGSRTASMAFRPWTQTSATVIVEAVERLLGFRPSSRRLDHETIVWEAATRRVLARLPGQSLPVFSPDGRLLATADDDGVSIWAVPSGSGD